VSYRDGSLTAPGGPTTVPAEESRSQIDEEPIPKLGGPTYKQVKPKTYQVLEEQLQSSEDASTAAASGTPIDLALVYLSPFHATSSIQTTSC